MPHRGIQNLLTPRVYPACLSPLVPFPSPLSLKIVLSNALRARRPQSSPDTMFLPGHDRG